MPVLEQDYRKGFNKFLEKENSLLSDFQDQFYIKKNIFDENSKDENNKNEQEVIKSELLNLQTKRLSPIETREILGKINPNILSGGNSSGKIDFTGKITTVEAKLGRNQFTVYPGQDIQHAINRAKDSGGGIVWISAGTYKPTANIVIPSALQLIGENTSTTIIDFNSTAFKIVAAGSNVYTTGTITNITGGVNVTGSGTLWLANVKTTYQFFIGQFWYRIKSINSNTSITLADGYGGGATFPGASYRIANVVKDIEFEEFTVKNSTGNAFDIDDVRNIIMEDIEWNSNNKGLVIDNTSEIKIDNSTVVSSTSNGCEFNNCGFFDVESFTIFSSGGHGMILNSCRSTALAFGASDGNTLDGVNITNCTDLFLQYELFSNGGQGVECVSGNIDIIMSECLVGDNTSDGIKLTASSNECKIINSQIKDGKAYGINIAASDCNNNIIGFNVIKGNSTGPYNDLGTNTEIGHNIIL